MQQDYQKIKKKLWISIFLLTVCIITLLSSDPVKASTLLDINKSSEYARQSIEYLSEKNIMTGNAGFFNPQAPITRAQMIALIIRTLEINTSNLPQKPDFKDVQQKHWAYKYIEAAYLKGITMRGPDEMFSPDEKCTREQMITMFVRSLGLSDKYVKNRSNFSHLLSLKDSNTISNWARETVEFSLSTGLMKGSGNIFDPLGVASREQVAVMLHRYVKNKINVEVGIPNIELYKAIQGSSQNPYKGTFKASILVTRKDVKSGQITSSKSVNMDGRANGAQTFANCTFQPYSGTVAGVSSNYKIFGINGRRYIKNSETGEWILSKVDELKSLSGFAINTQHDSKIAANELNKKLLDAYSRLSVEKAGTSSINGEIVTKFILNPIPFEIGETLTDILPETNSLEKEGIYFDRFTAEIYVNNQNKIVMETLGYDDSVISSGQTARLGASINIIFSNDGTTSMVVKPGDFSEQPIPDPKMNNKAVLFPNKKLKRIIETILDKDKVTEADMLQFTEFDASFQNIDNFTGLEYATNLKKLVLTGNQINSESFISSFKKLQYLDLNSSRVFDLSFINSLQDLRYLDISGNHYGSIEPLTHLKKLTELKMKDCPRNVSWNDLLGIQNLTRLSVGNYSNSDVEALGPLKVSEQLNAISKLTNLEELNMEGNELVDISPLKTLVKMKKIDLSSNSISNINALSGMTELTDVNLNFNHITDLNGLVGLGAIKKLSLSFNQISDVTPLKGLKTLEYLGLDFNSVHDISPLKELPILRVLSVQQNPILNK